MPVHRSNKMKACHRFEMCMFCAHESIAPVARFRSSSDIFVALRRHIVFPNLSDDVNTGILNGLLIWRKVMLIRQMGSLIQN
ncbi:hypothetical protein Tco_1345827 [Tanacetum coccineum]